MSTSGEQDTFFGNLICCSVEFAYENETNQKVYGDFEREEHACPESTHHHLV